MFKLSNTKKILFISFIGLILAISVSAQTTTLTYQGNLSDTSAAQPPNDNLANAEVVNGIQVHVTRSNVGATKEAGELNHAQNPGGKSVWFKWTAPMSRVMSFTTNRSAGNINTLLHFYTLNAQSNLQSVTFNNDIGTENLRSFARTAVTQGTTYYIAIDGFSDSGQSAAEGTFLLDIQPSFNFQGADYDSDGMTDLAYFRPSDGSWNYIETSSGILRKNFWGTSGDIPLVSATQGSGVNDLAVFRPSTGIWYQQTCCFERYTNWGTSSDIPVPANFGGGENTEIATFRPSDGIWYIRYSEDLYDYYRFGQAGDIPAPGHYSPDSNADVAIFRPSNGVWYFIKRISNNRASDTFNAVKFGQQGDKPVPADYDGDGILDVAIYRPSTGTWWVLQSSNGQTKVIQWGITEDIPTTGDYDGDGKFDFAVFRPSTGFWYVLRSSDGEAQIKQFGQSGDIPVTANRTF